MWISEKLGSPTDQFILRRGRLTIGGSEPAVEAEGEKRQVVILTPPGVAAVPEAGGSGAVCSFEGDTALVGCVSGSCAKELTLSAGGGSVKLSAAGVTISFGGGSVSLSADGIAMVFGSSRVNLTSAAASIGYGGRVITVSASGVTGDNY